MREASGTKRQYVAIETVSTKYSLPQEQLTGVIVQHLYNGDDNKYSAMTGSKVC